MTSLVRLGNTRGMSVLSLLYPKNLLALAPQEGNRDGSEVAAALFALDRLRTWAGAANDSRGICGICGPLLRSGSSLDPKWIGHV